MTQDTSNAVEKAAGNVDVDVTSHSPADDERSPERVRALVQGLVQASWEEHGTNVVVCVAPCLRCFVC
jgi:hypothetical protein